VEPLLGEASVREQRGADVPGADDGHPPAPIESEDSADLVTEMRDVVSQPAPSERAEAREILAHLRRGDAFPLRQPMRGDEALPFGFDFLEHAVVVREAANGG